MTVLESCLVLHRSCQNINVPSCFRGAQGRPPTLCSVLPCVRLCLPIESSRRALSWELGVSRSGSTWDPLCYRIAVQPVSRQGPVRAGCRRAPVFRCSCPHLCSSVEETVNPRPQASRPISSAVLWHMLPVSEALSPKPDCA